MSFYREGKIAVAVISQQMLRDSGATEDDMDDLAGLAGRSEGSLLNITIREQKDGSSKVSVRSTKDVSSSDICAVFGGGGHAMAAGCTIDCEPEKARDMLLAVVEEVWK
jgi:phosphoesterase RecJ-like protein